MFDSLYTGLTKRVPYKVLVFIPPLVSLLMAFLLMTRGVTLGIDFQGGTWMDILTDKALTENDLNSLKSGLLAQGLNDLKVYMGYDVGSGKNKLTIVTTTVVDSGNVSEIISPYTGALSEADVGTTAMAEKPPVWLSEKLRARFKEHVDVGYEDGIMTITALELNEEDLESALEYYLQQDMDVNVQGKNLNIRTVGPTLGKTFREQGIKALIVAFILMIVVIFMAFRDIVPSIAVLQAAVCDLLLALGGMSLLNIPLEPASLAALLMLLGYSVDSDILLTARVLKERRGEVNERIDDALKTGLTMTSTTLGVMVVVLFVSTTLTQIATLQSIASVLLLGLFGDITTTWFTNAGMLKWYLESPRGRRAR